ncbi:hypothetical protein RHGRI_012484 [Rhododendron griersonianum]|uniref:Uncharacterized protein n=1 Tax=Rhododendron griersonianum TaxID=479676 RepID=A0AAV6KR58_9ERIC|nr:hypothetical protein RHGRI_012484 [Rhododendron griersonianum]
MDQAISKNTRALRVSLYPRATTPNPQFEKLLGTRFQFMRLPYAPFNVALSRTLSYEKWNLIGKFPYGLLNNHLYSIQNSIEGLYWKQLDVNYPGMPDSMVHCTMRCV